MSAVSNPAKKSESSAFTVHTMPKSRIPRSFKFPGFLKKKKYIAVAGSALTAIVVVGIGLFFFQLYQKNQILNNPTAIAEKEQQAIVAQVGKLIELPQGEQPTVATVTDVTKLQGQQFFQNARNGDKVLIYPKAKEAILFDPVSNKIVRVGPVNISGQKQSVAGASTKATPVPQPVTVAIYNGTTTAGLASKTAKELATKMPSATVTEETNASSSAYKNTIVVDLAGNNAAAASHLASLLNGTVSSLPAGETKPTHADLLVILGK